MNDTTRNAHLAERRSSKRLDLQAEALLAMSRGEGTLHEFRKESSYEPGRVIERDYLSVLRDLLDDVRKGENESVLMRTLANVIQHSACPEMASWRLLFSSIYSERADDIADMENEE